MLTEQRVSHVVILYLENAIINRNSFDLRAYVESEEEDYDY